jgi:hypothetical protein
MIVERECVSVKLNANDGYAVIKQILVQAEEFMFVVTDDPLIAGQSHDLRFVPCLNNEETAHTLHIKADGTWELHTMVEA